MMSSGLAGDALAKRAILDLFTAEAKRTREDRSSDGRNRAMLVVVDGLEGCCTFPGSFVHNISIERERREGDAPVLMSSHQPQRAGGC